MADFHAIILAAGQSARMGREKSSLPWLEGQPLLLWMVEELSAGGWQPVVVLRPDVRNSLAAETRAGGCQVAPPHRGGPAPAAGALSSSAGGGANAQRQDPRSRPAGAGIRGARRLTSQTTARVAVGSPEVSCELIEGDLSQAFRCPIGLPLGRDTPEEIAISVAAEMLEVRGA